MHSDSLTVSFKAALDLSADGDVRSSAGYVAFSEVTDACTCVNTQKNRQAKNKHRYTHHCTFFGQHYLHTRPQDTGKGR